MKTIDEARSLVTQLLQQRTAREAKWHDLSKWICPYRGIFSGESYENQNGRQLLRFTHSASQAVLRAASGMTSGMTPRNVSWFKPDFVDPYMTEASGARPWLDDVDRLMKDCLASGGFYQAIQSFNIDLVWAGCALLFAELGEDNPLRFECPQIGTFAISMGQEGDIAAVARRLVFTPADMKGKFGENALSEAVRKLLKKEPYQQRYIWHLTVNNDSCGPFDIASYWWEEGMRDKFLLTGGYHEMPYFFTCWHEGISCYGTGPGDAALADGRQMDILERRKLEGLAKITDPPAMAPDSFKGAINLSAGAINYLPQQAQIRPILDMSYFAQSFGQLREEISVVAQRLEQTLMASIFNSLPLDQRPAGMSATEFLERKREALQQLGPVISSYEPNVLEPLLFRVLQTLDRQGQIMPMPQALVNGAGQGEALMKVEFISPMANALRQTGAETTRALFQDVAMMMQQTQNSEILDKIDTDQMIDELATGLGCPGRKISAQADVAQIRQQRQAAQQAQMQMQMAMQQAQLGQAEAGAVQGAANAQMALDQASGESGEDGMGSDDLDALLA